jgi:hypothetical protein
MTDRKPEIRDLDETQLEALREQLKAIVGGLGATTSAFSPTDPTHDTSGAPTHNNSDAWF